MEKWSWEDPATHLRTTGYNVPSGVHGAKQVPVFIKFVTQSGKLEQGNVICLKVNRRKHQRMVQFVESKEIRIVCDYLVIEVDGTRFLTH